jgi:hypothetical protein
MREQQFLPVNWTDGMKINKSHFVSQENALASQLMQTASGLLNDYNYGLMPSHDLGLKLFLSVDNQQQVNLRIQQCRAISRGGFFFQINDDTGIYKTALVATVPDLCLPFEHLKGRAETFFVILSVNPYERIPYGAFDPEEVPVRIPYTIPSFNLNLVPIDLGSSNISGQFHLPVGKLRVDEQRVMLDDNYIPPSCTVSSHAELMAIHAGLEQFYSRMESYALQIIQKIYQKKQVNEMSAIVQKLCETMITLIASQLAEIKTLCLNQSPVFMVNKVASMARLFKNTLDYYIGSGKEEFINYCTEWCNVNQVELESSTTNLSNHTYNHLDVNASIDKVLHFTRTISNLFGNLSRLDYIGKKKDAGIFVHEKAMTYEAEQPVIKRRSFLAD